MFQKKNIWAIDGVRRQRHADSSQEEKAIGLGRVRDVKGGEAVTAARAAWSKAKWGE